MDELRDVLKVFRFAMRLKDFKSFTRGQKLKTGAVGAGLTASIFGFFSGGGLIPLEDFQLTAEHQVVNAACLSVMENRGAEFDTVYNSENCACTAREWAARSYNDSYRDFEEAYSYMIDFYMNYDFENTDEELDYARIGRDLVREYSADNIGSETEVIALRRARMQQAADVMAVCANYESYQGDAFKRMISLPVKGENPHKDPITLDDGRVEIALRGDIRPVALTATQ